MFFQFNSFFGIFSLLVSAKNIYLNYSGRHYICQCQREMRKENDYESEDEHVSVTKPASNLAICAVPLMRTQQSKGKTKH